MEKTPDQLAAAYQESFRQEARGMLMLIHAIGITKAGKKAEPAINDLQYTGFPFDPDTDEDFGTDSLRELKKVLGSELING